MRPYLALLRGINVAGKNIIRMFDLKAMFEDLGHTDVVTYLQSGNVIFKSIKKESCAKTASVLSKAIQQRFQLDIPVLVITKKDVDHIVENNPFLKVEKTETAHCYVTFLFEPPATEQLKRLVSPANESGRFSSTGSEIYLHCPDGYGRTKINNQFFEKRLKTSATTRNWKTLLALQELSH